MEAAKSFHLLSVNCRSATAAVREAWHFSAPDARALLRRAADAWPGLEAVVVAQSVKQMLHPHVRGLRHWAGKSPSAW